MALSENLKIAREQKGYSLEYVANRVHVERQTIWKYEQGIAVPNGILLVEIADVFGTTCEKLVKSNAKKFLSEISNN